MQVARICLHLTWLQVWGLPLTNVGPFSGFAGIPAFALSGCRRGPDGPSSVDYLEFPEADLSDCDDAPELSVGSLGDVGWGPAGILVHSLACRHLEWLRLGRLQAGFLLSRSTHVFLPEVALLCSLWILCWSLPKSFLLCQPLC